MRDSALNTRPDFRSTLMKNTSVSIKLAEIRKLSNLEPREVAQILGASLVAVHQWERGVSIPSGRQQEIIDTVLSDLRQGRPARIPSVVLQNGSFASRGSRRKDLLFSQPDLFSLTPSAKFVESPLPHILARVKSDIFLGSGAQRIQQILDDHKQPARTLDEAPELQVSAGKNTYTYDAHTYHTKVPPQAIVEILERYLPDGGLILDPFAGSGMTGVAARVSGMDAILNELSPAACFISHNFTEPVCPTAFSGAIETILSSLNEVRSALYETTCRKCGRITEILYTVWSYRVLCPQCQSEFVLWDHCRKYGRTVREHKILKEFPCPSCKTRLYKRELQRTTAVPVLLGYKCCSGTQTEHPLTGADLQRINDIDNGFYLAGGFYPTTVLPEGVNLNQPRRHGLTSVDKFYSSRNLAAMSQLWREIHRIADDSLASAAAFAFTSLYQRVTRFSEFRFWGGSGNTARFNVPYIFNEANVFLTFQRKAASIIDHLQTTASRYGGRTAVACHSATDLRFISDESIDLIFTDPPFGANINYSEMNILWESWLGEFTDSSNEAIISRAQGKQIQDYEDLMTKSLAECYRVLRPGHWMLLVFMNSSSQVWSALKSAIRRAGFVTERLDILDKQHGTFKQFVSERTAGCDLVLHCRKPAHRNEDTLLIPTNSAKNSIRDFLHQRNGSMPMTKYLHVAREDETDLRRLYSEWLSHSLLTNDDVLGFADFRDQVAQIMGNKELNGGTHGR
jgi:DNA modification methylase